MIDRKPMSIVLNESQTATAFIVRWETENRFSDTFCTREKAEEFLDLLVKIRGDLRWAELTAEKADGSELQLVRYYNG